VKDEVEMTVIEKHMSAGMSTRPTALRIKKLPKGTVAFEIILQKNVTGEVLKEAVPPKGDAPPNPGLIYYSLDGVEAEVAFYPIEKDEDILVEQDSDKVPEVGDKVKFDMAQSKKNRKLVAVKISVTEARPPLFDPNTEVPPLPPSPLMDEYPSSSNLTPFLAPVPDSLPSPLKPTQLVNNNRTPSASPAPLVNFDSDYTNVKREYEQRQQQLHQMEEYDDDVLIHGLEPYSSSSSPPTTGDIKYKGYVAALRDGFGFIETLERDKDVFFRLA
jgi:cold shock CspA family protein